jgi:trigger factor
LHPVQRGFFVYLRKATVNVTVENLAPCRRLVRVEVDAATVDAAIERATAGFRREARFPGFRPGKAPLDLVVRTYSKQIEEEAKNRLISENYRKAIQEQKLTVVTEPEIEEIQFGRGEPLQFAATVEVMPEFELPDYKGIPIQREQRAVTDEDVERAVQVLREQRATYQDLTRPVQANDFVVVNYKGTSEGKPLTEYAPTARGLTEQSNFWLHVEPNSFIPGFTEQLIGAQAGERRTVTVDFPADFVAAPLSGKKGEYEVEVLQVKEKVLPEVTEEFARLYGAENLEKLREGVRNDLQNELEFKQRRVMRNQIIKSLLDRTQFELPESLLLSETKHVLYDFLRENQERGMSQETIDQQKDEIYNYASNSAKDRLKAGFLLNRIAEKEDIKVTEREIVQRILLLADQNNIKPERLMKQLKERNGLGEIRDQILTSKTIDFLQANAREIEVPPSSPTPG